jgi:hypothetical protein
MQITLNTLRRFLDSGSFQTNGDNYEREFGRLLAGQFPNCERFWKFFVVPLTERMRGYPVALFKNIGYRQGMNHDLEDIAATHYSMFMHLVYAHINLQQPTLSALEDFYVHLASACDLVETFLEKSYLLLLQCRGEQSQLLQRLTRDEFLQLAAKWYDENYLTVYGHYLSKGKFRSMPLPSRPLLIKEFVKDYLGQASLWKDYDGHSRAIRELRNVIVHDVQLGRFVVDDKIFIPRPKVIQNYRTWRQVFAVVDDQNKFYRDFAEWSQQMKEDLDLLQSILNRIWELVITEVNLEFYQEDKTLLRHLYQVQI